MNAHRTAMLSVIANLHQCQELAATRVTDTALTAYASAIALVESELARADQLTATPTASDPFASMSADLSKLRDLHDQEMAGLKRLQAILDDANRKSG